MAAFAKLIAADFDVPYREIPLNELPRRVGRCPDADICVEDRWVSRYHCEIDLIDGVLTVRDLNSKHGTFVNGRAIERAELKPGDVLNVGLSKFHVQYEFAVADRGRGAKVMACPPR